MTNQANSDFAEYIDTFGLPGEDLALMRRAMERFPEVETALIYGSRAKGTARRFSDIDLSLKGVGLSRGLLGQIAALLDALNTPYCFDLNIYDEIRDVHFRQQIDACAKIFYQKATKR